jgi:hypothetical protein
VPKNLLTLLKALCQMFRSNEDPPLELEAESSNCNNWRANLPSRRLAKLQTQSQVFGQDDASLPERRKFFMYATYIATGLIDGNNEERKE